MKGCRSQLKKDQGGSQECQKVEKKEIKVSRLLSMHKKGNRKRKEKIDKKTK